MMLVSANMKNWGLVNHWLHVWSWTLYTRQHLVQQRGHGQRLLRPEAGLLPPQHHGVVPHRGHRLGRRQHLQPIRAEHRATLHQSGLTWSGPLCSALVLTRLAAFWWRADISLPSPLLWNHQQILETSANTKQASDQFSSRQALPMPRFHPF